MLSKLEKTEIDINFLQKKAREIRATSVQLAYDGQTGHLGSALSYVDALVALYYYWLNISPSNIGDVQRDRFILSKGHGCVSHYVALADQGFIPKEWLHEYACAGKPLSSHPCKHLLDVLECSSGSLGYGLGIATGMLYGARLDKLKFRIAVLMGDGECNEGSVWESAMFAAAHHMDNLIALVDYNGIQAVGRSDEIMGHTSLEEKFRAFGWGAMTVDGNDIKAVVSALDQCPLKTGKPTAIVLKTLKGAGVSFMEDDHYWHGVPPKDEDLEKALSNLEETLKDY